MQTQTKHTSKTSKGFSLVELLIVVAVIGIIAAIAIPSIGSVTNASKTATYQRNAQNVVSTFQSAQAAGVDWGAVAATTKASLITSVVTGASPTSGPYSGKMFRCAGLTAADIVNCKPYIGKDSTDYSLYYTSAGGDATP